MKKSKRAHPVLQGTILLFLIWIVPSQCFSQLKSEVVKIGKGDWCPYVCSPSTNQGKIGYVAEILDLIYTSVGLKVEFIPLNFSRGIDLVRRAEIDIMACMYRDDAPELVYPGQTLGVSINYFFTQTGDPWKYVEDSSLAKRRLGLVKGYTYPEFQSYIDNNGEMITYMHGREPMSKLLKMLVNNRIDTIFDDGNVVVYEAGKSGRLQRIRNGGGFGLKNRVMVGFAPGSSRTPRLLSLLESGLEQLRQNGRLKEIVARYGLEDWQK